MSFANILNYLVPYSISIGIIIYASLLIHHANTIIDKALNNNSGLSDECKSAKNTQGFGIAVLCVGIVLLLATIHNTFPNVLNTLGIFAARGGKHPIVKYLMIIAMLVVCSIILSTLVSDTSKCGSNPTLLIIINSILIGLMGLFLMYKIYEVVKNKGF